MLIYSRIVGESAPEAFVLVEADPTVSDLLSRVGAARSAQGRTVELVVPGAVPTATLADLGVTDGALVDVRAIGEPVPDTTAPTKPDIDIDAIRMPINGSRRLNEYEEATRLLQWHAPYHIDGERPAHQVWTSDSTALRCTDWEAYRSPDKLYYRTYTTKQSRAGRSVATAFEFAAADAQLGAVAADRVALLRNVLGPLQYPDWGLCVTHQHTTRFALSSWIAGATSFMMFDELRHAQLYGRLAMAYGEHHDGFDDPAPAWMEDSVFQPSRRLVEEIMATLDWGKAIILADIVFEPLHTAAANALLTTGSLAAGDSLTPFVCRSIGEDKGRHRESAAAFLRLLTGDELHAAHNRELIGEWVADLLPRAHSAAIELAGAGGGSVDVFAEPLSWICSQLQDCHIATPAMLSTPEEVSA
ncbi:hypothetical protein ACQ856_14510 [Mycolicibacterium psychrotolerans]|uniref:hypothetical protein n=1 Tax=Mycolicibacterium psychrotolerans TaxID=216929 RepID=UPI003D6669CE